jgi:hypothetical protein
MMMDYQDAPRLMFARRQRIQQSRTPHLCGMCRKAIDVGQPSVKVVMMDDEMDKPGTDYYHPQCEYGPVDDESTW